MRFTPQFLDELRARLPVSEVVGRRVKLTRAGREWKGLSPFNKEKTPSFFVNDQKQAWFDFSSGKNGSIFDFVMQTEGVTFPEAVERLASLAGVALPKVTVEDQQRDARRKTLHDVMEIAAKFFEQTLASRGGAKARGYLADRGIDSATQLKFRLGYAPNDRHALKEHLGNQGIAVPDMIEAGLLIAGDDIPVPYDRFRDRVMFPIADLRSRVIAFGGRALEKDVPAKYLNSPETPLFHKGATLYNIAAARQAVHAARSTQAAQDNLGASLVVVEGYVDVIAMVGAGYPATVAPLGTALTEDQLGLLWKMADEPILCFDGDGAGIRAAYRAAQLAVPRLTPGKSLRFALLPEGQDPDDLARAGGREAIKDVIDAAQPLSQMLWARETEGQEFDTPERRAKFEARIGELVAAIADESVRKYYRQDFNARLAQMFAPPERSGGGYYKAPRGAYNGPRREWNGERQGQPRNNTARGPGDRPASYLVVSPQLAASPLVRGHRTAMSRREALLLIAVLNHPWLLHDHMEEFAALEFRHAETERLKATLIDRFASHDERDHDEREIGERDRAPDPVALIADLGRRGFGELIERVGASITTHGVWGVGADAAPQDVLVTWQQLVGLHRQWNSLIKELKDAEQALGQDSSEANHLRLLDVKSRLFKMEGTEAQIEGFGGPSGRPPRNS